MKEDALTIQTIRPVQLADTTQKKATRSMFRHILDITMGMMITMNITVGAVSTKRKSQHGKKRGKQYLRRFIVSIGFQKKQKRRGECGFCIGEHKA